MALIARVLTVVVLILAATAVAYGQYETESVESTVRFCNRMPIPVHVVYYVLGAAQAQKAPTKFDIVLPVQRECETVTLPSYSGRIRITGMPANTYDTRRFSTAELFLAVGRPTWVYFMNGPCLSNPSEERTCVTLEP